jgi:phosphodiesterase/alkaline phosphatase D-like protein
LARYGLAVIRWTTNNPGGTDLHYAVVHYGTDPEDMAQIARSPSRLRKSDATTTLRVRIQGLKAGTTYYYWVESFQANGIPDGAKSGMNQFTMPERPYVSAQP